MGRNWVVKAPKTINGKLSMRIGNKMNNTLTINVDTTTKKTTGLYL